VLGKGLTFIASLLIAKSILAAAIGTLPGNPIAGHAPYIFMHAALANIEPASALPAEHEFLAAAVALLRCFATFASFADRMGLLGHWNIRSWFITFVFLFGQLRLSFTDAYGVLSFMPIHGTTGPRRHSSNAK
jgi:TRAP-type uncharacterized transport system fused permease subunit